MGVILDERRAPFCAATNLCWRTESAIRGIVPERRGDLASSEAVGADIQNMGVERGHRTLVITRKGGKIATIPLAPRTARATDLEIGERCDGPVVQAQMAGGWTGTERPGSSGPRLGAVRRRSRVRDPKDSPGQGGRAPASRGGPAALAGHTGQVPRQRLGYLLHRPFPPEPTPLPSHH